MFEVLLSLRKAYDDTLPPGGQVRIAGSDYYGYYGEFRVGLPNGEDFCNLVGVTEGSLLNTDISWFKLTENNRIIYIPNVPLRNFLRWQDIDSKGLWYGKEIQIGKHRYICRVMTGVASKSAGSAGGEWNRHIYALSAPKQAGAANFESFNSTKMGWLGGTNSGGANWVQEEQAAPTYRYYRGFNGLTHVGKEVVDSNLGNYGWRPILEYVDPTVTPSIGPGPADLVAGSIDLGYYGRVDNSLIATPEEMAAAVGLTAGILLPAGIASPNWLKFRHRNTVLFIPQKPLRSGMSWNDLSSMANRGVEITLKGYKYRCRLMYIALTDTGVANNSSNISREWKDLMCNVHATATGSLKWESFTDADIGINGGLAGRYCWGQEQGTVSGNLAYAGVGYSNYTTIHINVPTNVDVHMGWRPVLELIGEA